MSKRKSNRNLSRRTAQKEPYQMILIVCEGEKTEINYFKDLIKVEKLSSVNITICSGCGSDPVSVVTTAIKKREEQDMYLSFDAVYCAIDRDEHKNFDQAIQQARDNDIKLIVSYPSFEYWYLCHFHYSRSPIVRTNNRSPGDNCIHILKPKWKNELNEEYEKNIENPYTKLNKYIDQALTNAKNALKDAESNQEPNPSTRVHELVDVLRSIKNVKC